MMPDSTVVPAITTGGTDAKFFRWKGIPAYGFGLHSLRIPYTEYPVMFHGHNERVDTESLKLSAIMGDTLPRWLRPDRDVRVDVFSDLRSSPAKFHSAATSRLGFVFHAAWERPAVD
jgi:hypothetical protein